MDKNRWGKKIIFVLTCCIYLIIMGTSVFLLSQPFFIKVNEAAAVGGNLVSEKVPDQLHDEEQTVGVENTLASVWGKKAEKMFHPIITQVANQYEVDPALIKAIIWAESSFNPNAVSQKGAIGLMQLMPATAKSLGVEDCLNPEKNIDAGVRYFKQLMIRFNGDAELALAAYNAGSRRVREYQGVPPFKATQFYVKKVFEYYQEYKKNLPEDVNQI